MFKYQIPNHCSMWQLINEKFNKKVRTKPQAKEPLFISIKFLDAIATLGLEVSVT